MMNPCTNFAEDCLTFCDCPPINEAIVLTLF
jgi:hypothetical protein